MSNNTINIYNNCGAPHDDAAAAPAPAPAPATASASASDEFPLTYTSNRVFPVAMSADCKTLATVEGRNVRGMRLVVRVETSTGNWSEQLRVAYGSDNVTLSVHGDYLAVGEKGAKRYDIYKRTGSDWVQIKTVTTLFSLRQILVRGQTVVATSQFDGSHAYDIATEDTHSLPSARESALDVHSGVYTLALLNYAEPTRVFTRAGDSGSFSEADSLPDLSQSIQRSTSVSISGNQMVVSRVSSIHVYTRPSPLADFTGADFTGGLIDVTQYRNWLIDGQQFYALLGKDIYTLNRDGSNAVFTGVISRVITFQVSGGAIFTATDNNIIVNGSPYCPPPVPPSQGPAPVNLGTAANYVLLSKAGVTTTGLTSITGNVGTSPIAGTALTGFALTAHSSNTFFTSPIVHVDVNGNGGKIYSADLAAPTPAIMGTAILDLGTAFSDAVSRAPTTVPERASGLLDGLTFQAGVHKWSSPVSFASGITLNGSADDVFIFIVAQTFVLGAGASVTLTGGAQAKNIFWAVSGYTQLTSGAKLFGNILCATQIVFQAGSELVGRALAQTAITMIATTISMP
jgi:hypothetical protein